MFQQSLLLRPVDFISDTIPLNTCSRDVTARSHFPPVFLLHREKKKQEADPGRLSLSLEGGPSSPAPAPPEAFHSPRRASPKPSPQDIHGVGTARAAARGRQRVREAAGRSPPSPAPAEGSAACGGWGGAVEGGGASGAALGASEGRVFRAVEALHSPSSGVFVCMCVCAFFTQTRLTGKKMMNLVISTSLRAQRELPEGRVYMYVGSCLCPCRTKS